MEPPSKFLNNPSRVELKGPTPRLGPQKLRRYRTRAKGQRQFLGPGPGGDTAGRIIEQLWVYFHLIFHSSFRGKFPWCVLSTDVCKTTKETLPHDLLFSRPICLLWSTCFQVPGLVPLDSSGKISAVRQYSCVQNSHVVFYRQQIRQQFHLDVF